MPPAREKSVASDATADHGEIMHQSTLNKPKEDLTQNLIREYDSRKKSSLSPSSSSLVN